MINISVQKLESLSGWRGFLLNFVLGGFAVLGHAPFYLWPVTIVCLAVFMIRLDGAQERVKPRRSGAGTGFAFGFGYFLFGFYWIGSAFIARGPEFAAIMPFAILLFCAGLSLFWVLAGYVYVRMVEGGRARSSWRAGVFACILFLVEFARGHVFGGFPWNLPGYIFAAGKPVSQIASMVGIYGVSALVLGLSACVALLISDRKLGPLVAGVLVLSAVFTYGNLRLKAAPISTTQYVEGVKLRIVHANISQKDKFDSSKYVRTVNHYFNLSVSEGFDEITHVIWPEGAVPGLMFEDEGLMQALERLMRSKKGSPPVFIAQTLRAEKRENSDKYNYYNAAAAISFPDNAPLQISPYYDKQRLVPFGEFIPGGDFVERLGLTSLSSALESMSAGENGDVPVLPGLPPVSLQICYEIIFPGFTPAHVTAANVRPEWILNLSNDSWYGDSSGPRQHINQARYRAIEQGVPVVRSTSGGISGVIDSYGRQLVQKNITEDGALDVALPRPLGKYPYNRHVSFIICLLMFCILLGCRLGMKPTY